MKDEGLGEHKRGGSLSWPSAGKWDKNTTGTGKYQVYSEVTRRGGLGWRVRPTQRSPFWKSKSEGDEGDEDDEGDQFQEAVSRSERVDSVG